ncbi:WXG100 family type VII secretion target [Actinomycetospora termitidis]|uniref:ESAT-6-like protein n=1 Tax=Actinomycetospora termitidis TaxID=3053470 RepID=A0ABT7M5X1_9PSEU|nr:WXG100 family type VII secretion target [Actinomycetospora sp. Odt1-22]MDL5155472.1 WXG100 family type VII secretion target [Actinomycetospora sp. Odt1-22]
MTGQFGTETQLMQGAGQHVIDVRDQIAAQLAQLRGQLVPLEATWRGDASTAFTQLMARWNDDANRINAALGAIAESVTASGVTYRAAEDEVAASTSQITQALA